MSSLNAVEAKIRALETEREKLREKVKPLRDRLVEISQALLPLEDERDKLRIVQGAVDWKSMIWDLGAGDRGTVRLLHHFGDLLKKQFHMWHGGYWVETGETAIKLMIVQDDPSTVEKNIAGIKFFTPMLKPHPNGMVKFGIFEHTLSEFGSYEFEVAPDLSRAVIHRNGSSVAGEFKSIEEAVEYIRQNHYYSESEKSEE